MVFVESLSHVTDETPIDETLVPAIYCPLSTISPTVTLTVDIPVIKFEPIPIET